jgi:hypothetical protein
MKKRQKKRQMLPSGIVKLFTDWALTEKQQQINFVNAVKCAVAYYDPAWEKNSKENWELFEAKIMPNVEYAIHGILDKKPGCGRRNVNHWLKGAIGVIFCNLPYSIAAWWTEANIDAYKTLLDKGVDAEEAKREILNRRKDEDEEPGEEDTEEDEVEDEVVDRDNEEKPATIEPPAKTDQPAQITAPVIESGREAVELAITPVTAYPYQDVIPESQETLEWGANLPIPEVGEDEVEFANRLYDTIADHLQIPQVATLIAKLSPSKAAVFNLFVRSEEATEVIVG